MGPRRSTEHDEAPYTTQSAGQIFQILRFANAAAMSSIGRTDWPPIAMDTDSACGNVSDSPTA